MARPVDRLMQEGYLTVKMGLSIISGMGMSSRSFSNSILESRAWPRLSRVKKTRQVSKSWTHDEQTRRGKGESSLSCNINCYKSVGPKGGLGGKESQGFPIFGTTESTAVLTNAQGLHQSLLTVSWDLCARGSRFSRPGTETPRLSVQVSSRNRSRNRY